MKEILSIFCELHPYKVAIRELLEERDRIQRKFFCDTIKQLLVREDEEFHEKRIIFSDEAHFWLNGYVDKQNYWFQYQGEDDSDVAKATPKVIV